MKKSIFKFSGLLLFVSVLFNGFVLSDLNPLFLGSIYSSIYLFFVPGILIKKLLRIEQISFFESITYIVGLSIAFILLVGISTNSLSLLHIIRPLNTINSLIVFDLYLITLFLINLITRGNLKINFYLPKLTFTEVLFYLVPFIFPILSILGTQLLNNNGSNILTMILLSAIGFYIFLTAIFFKKLKSFSFEIPIYLIAISLLLMFSLRSSFIIGWDIYQEYKVFLLTQSHQFWSMQNYQDPYNACLSITILPTVIQYFTKINNPYIFKLLFQFIFAVVPVTIYLFTRKLASPFISFLSVFFFMSTLDFFMEMPALIRQEIAFIFFGLLLSTIFNKKLLPLQKRMLFIIFGLSIVLSHYSTTYILIGLLGFSCLFLTGYRVINMWFIKKITTNSSIELIPVIVLTLFTFFWLGFVTKTSTNLLDTLDGTLKNISNFEQQTFNTSVIDQLIFFPKVDNANTLLLNNINDAHAEYLGYNFSFYPKYTYNNYVPAITQKDDLQLNVSQNISNLIYSIGNYITKIIKILIILGFVGVFILFRKKSISIEYVLLSVGFAIILIMLTSIPGISLFYPIGRLDQQTLFLISVSTVLSLSWLLRFIDFRPRILIISIFFIVYFFYSTTFISQLIGGKGPEVILNNAGRYYNEIYLHTSELKSINWLYSNKDKYSSVFADLGASEKIKTYSSEIKPNVYLQVFPSLIDKNSYVYSSYANTLYGIGIINIKVDRMEYNFPTSFLNKNKNLIYNNGHSEIFK